MSFVAESVVSEKVTETLFRKSQSAPLTSTLSLPASSYVILASLPSPKVKNVSSGIITSPVPFGSK